MTDKSDINFIAIDFETATSKRASICEVGICVVRHGEIAETRSWLVRPEDNRYQYWNIKYTVSDHRIQKMLLIFVKYGKNRTDLSG